MKEQTNNNLHQSLWDRFEPFLAQQNLPQALLIIASQHMVLLQWARQFIARCLCQHNQKDAQNVCSCQSCHWLHQGVHPDVHWLQPDQAHESIKIESVRELAQRIYHTTELGRWRFVVIQPAQQLNLSSANALLKMLEEPPKQVIFLLLAEHMHSLPLTLMSRCQCYVFNNPYDCNEEEMSTLAALILSVIQQRVTVCTAAEQWLQGTLNTHKIHLLYALTAQLLQAHYIPQHDVINMPQALIQMTKPQQLFQTLTFLQHALRQFKQKVTLNPLLLLEKIFMSFSAGEYTARGQDLRFSDNVKCARKEQVKNRKS